MSLKVQYDAMKISRYSTMCAANETFHIGIHSTSRFAIDCTLYYGIRNAVRGEFQYSFFFFVTKNKEKKHNT